MQKHSHYIYRDTTGATLAEYAILTGLIAVVSIVAVSGFGWRVEGVFQSTAVALDTPGASGISNGEIVANQSFVFDGYATAGAVVGTVQVSNATPNGYALQSDTDSLFISSVGEITLVDASAFGSEGTTKLIGVSATLESGDVLSGFIEVTRGVKEDLPNDQTTVGRITVGVTEYNIYEAGDTGDWFNLTTEAEGHLQIIARSSDHDGAAMSWPMITLRNSAGAQLEYSGENFSNQGAILHNNLPAGDYFVSISKSWRGTSGGYKIDAAFVEDEAIATADAHPISLDETQYSDILYGDLGDRRVFTLTEPQHVQFIMDATYGDRDSSQASMSLRDSSGNLVASSTASYWTSYAGFLYNDLPAGTYYLLSQAAGGKYWYDYSLSVAAQPTDQRNNINTEATVILAEVDATRSASQGSFILGDTGDWYKLAVNERTHIQVEVDTLNGDLNNYTLYLRASDGSQIDLQTTNVYAGEDFGNNFVFHDVPAGIYYLDLAKNSATDRREGDYQIGAGKIIDAPETIEMAELYDFGTISGKKDHGESLDIYKFNPTTSFLATLSLSPDTYSAANAEVLDSAGNIISQTWPARSTQVNLVAGETYYVRTFSVNHVGDDYSFSFGSGPSQQERSVFP